MIRRPWSPRVISCNLMDFKALLLIQGVIVATCLSTFVAARQLAPEPSASSQSASSSSSSLCSRALATTLWGAAFAFFILVADAWPACKTFSSIKEQTSLLDRSFILLLLGPVAPLVEIYWILGNLFTTLRFRQILRSSTTPELAADATSMSNKLRRVIDDIRVILFGINQPRGFLKRTRIVSNTWIVLGMSDSTRLFIPQVEDNWADALTLGHKTAENSCLRELDEEGKLALLESSIIPNYKQLRFVDGRSGIATLILAVQATGYVTSIVYRASQHLPVSPIEAIGFAYSLLVIVHSLVHSVAVMCQNPLVIYLNPTQEQEIRDKCESTRWSNVDEKNRETAAVVGTVVVGSVVVALPILVEWHVLRISWLDAIGPILFFISLIPQSCIRSEEYSLCPGAWSSKLITFGGFMISVGGIVVSIVATILNWQTHKFDSRTPSVIHILPFLS